MANKAQIFQTLLSGLSFDGAVLASGKVYFYAPGTTTLKAVYTTRTKTVQAANPYTLDSNGQASVFGDGVYDIKVTTSADVQKAYWYNVALQDYTSVATATIDDYASLTAAVTAIGSTVTRLVINSATTLTANTTIPSTLELEFTRAGSVNKGAHTLTFSNSIPLAGLYQIFSGAGTVSGLKFARPEWWGAVADNDAASATTNASAINTALQAVVDVQGKVQLWVGTYYIDASIVAPTTIYHDHAWTLEGMGDGTIIANVASASKPTISIVGATAGTEPYGFTLRNFAVIGKTTYPNTGIYVEHAHRWTMEGITSNANGKSFHIKGCIWPTMRRISAWPAGQNAYATQGHLGATGGPTTVVTHFEGDASYSVNVLILDDYKSSMPTATDGITFPNVTGISNIQFSGYAGVTYHLTNITIEGGADNTGIEVTAPTGGSIYFNFNVKNYHVETVGEGAGRYVFTGNTIREGKLNLWGGSATGQTVALQNCVNFIVDNSAVANFTADNTNILCGSVNSNFEQSYNNSSVNPVTLQSRGPGGGGLRNQQGTPSYTTYAHSAGNYTGSASMTWTTEPADQNTFHYTVANGMLQMSFIIDSSSVGGTPDKELRITLPESITCKYNTISTGIAIDNGGAEKVVRLSCDANATYLKIYNGMGTGTDWTASTNATSVYGQISIPIK